MELTLEIKQEILAILDEILSLKGRSNGFDENTPLLGAIPELDSMAVVALITTLEERFGFAIDDDEIMLLPGAGRDQRVRADLEDPMVAGGP